MKILQLSAKVPYPPLDGGALATFNLAKSFAKQGHSVTILAFNTTKHYIDIELIPEKIKKIIKIIAVDINTNLNVYQAFKNLFFSELPYLTERFYSNLYKDKIRELLVNEKFDLVQIEGLHLCIFIPFIRKYSNAKISFRAHNIEHEIWKKLHNNTRNILKKIYLKILVKRIKQLKAKIINTYDLLVPITQDDSLAYFNFGNKKPSIIIPCGIDIYENILIEKTVKTTTLCYLGALDWMPNQEGLIWFIDNCLDAIVKQLPDLKLHIAGRNAPKFIVDKFSKPSIVYHGEIPVAKDFLEQYDILIVPVFSGSGMRVKIIEGMSLGKVVVSSTFGASGIPVNNKKNILLADTSNEFVNAIVELSDNLRFANSIAVEAHKFAKENYDNFSLTEQLVKFYQQNLT